MSFNIEELIDASDNDLFKKVCNRIHCLSSLLPPSNRAISMFNLRPLGHDLLLPSVKKVLFKIVSLCELSLNTNSLVFVVFFTEYIFDIYCLF